MTDIAIAEVIETEQVEETVEMRQLDITELDMVGGGAAIYLC